MCEHMEEWASTMVVEGKVGNSGLSTFRSLAQVSANQDAVRVSGLKAGISPDIQ